MNIPADNERTRSVQTILTQANKLRNSLAPSMRQEIRQRLLDHSQTQYEIADWLMQELHLTPTYQSSTRRAVGLLVQDLLSEQEIEERKQHMQERNASLAHSTDYDRSEAGKQGGESRARQFIENGTNPAGHAIWDDAAISRLRDLLDNEQNYYQDGRNEGRPNIPLIADQFNRGLNGSSRTANSIRLKVRRLLNDDDSNGEE